jgi:Zn-dependent protease
VNGSIKIGSILGITIRVHLLLLLLAGILVLKVPDPLTAVLLLVTLFGIVLLHEMAHSVVAMRFGLRVVDITLWPLGGMARMAEIPESSRIEGWIAIAGPALNFALAALAFPFFAWSVVSDVPSPDVKAWLYYFFVSNLLMGGFNLLPAFPMDGGRILRAFLGRKGDWVLATERAVNIGRTIAVLLALFGFMTWSWWGMQSLSFILIALFVWWAGPQELHAVRARHGIDPLAAFRAFAARASGWSQSQPATEFARAPQPSPAPPPVSGPGAGAGGFSAEEIEKLERFRGPLRSFPPDEV